MRLYRAAKIGLFAVILKTSEPRKSAVVKIMSETIQHEDWHVVIENGEQKGKAGDDNF